MRPIIIFILTMLITASAYAQKPPAGMVLIPAGSYTMGAADDDAMPDEKPLHTVHVKAFYLDAAEVTNAQFARFVAATGYVTTAERTPQWQEIKKQLPPGTPRPPDSLLTAGALVFSAPAAGSLASYTQWWQFAAGASWRHPQGPQSDIKGKDNYPVVQVSWYDARAYCRWAHKRLPTEAEWEYAARGGKTSMLYPWGNNADSLSRYANTWQGLFPSLNTGADGYLRTAPAKSYLPNAYGLYDMAGNVWEWCADVYGPYTTAPHAAPAAEYVLRGGSFLCNAGYCSGYRVSRRSKATADSGMEHAGFRCAADI